jgi:hypothetical protein
MPDVRAAVKSGLDEGRTVATWQIRKLVVVRRPN